MNRIIAATLLGTATLLFIPPSQAIEMLLSPLVVGRSAAVVADHAPAGKQYYTSAPLVAPARLYRRTLVTTSRPLLTADPIEIRRIRRVKGTYKSPIISTGITPTRLLYLSRRRVRGHVCGDDGICLGH